MFEDLAALIQATGAARLAGATRQVSSPDRIVGPDGSPIPYTGRDTGRVYNSPADPKAPRDIPPPQSVPAQPIPNSPPAVPRDIRTQIPGAYQVAQAGGTATDALPQVGPLPGKLFLDPSVTAGFAPGRPRPFGPGEYVQNPDGTWSSEITTTVGQGDAPGLNGGKASVIPTLWLVNGQPVRVDEDTAARYAAESGLQFPSFASAAEAEAYSTQREAGWQKEGIAPADLSKQIGALWTRQK